MAKVTSLQQALKLFLFLVLAVDAHLAIGVWILSVGFTWLYCRASL